MKRLGILKTKQNIHLMKQINIPEQIFFFKRKINLS